MGLWDTLLHGVQGVTEPEQLAEQLISRPWTGTFGIISATTTSRKDFADAFTGNNTDRVYRLERLTVVNNSAGSPITVTPNGDLLRAVRVGAGGGSAVIDHPDIRYFTVKNEHATTDTVDGDIIWAGDAFRR